MIHFYIVVLLGIEGMQFDPVVNWHAFADGAIRDMPYKGSGKIYVVQCTQETDKIEASTETASYFRCWRDLLYDSKPIKKDADLCTAAEKQWQHDAFCEEKK